MQQNELKAALFFGGPSAESDVSILTALGAIPAMELEEIDTTPVYLHPEGPWFTDPSLKNKETFSNIDLFSSTLASCSLSSPQKSKKPLLKIEEKGVIGSLKALFHSSPSITFDVAVLACHGQIGENGALGGLLELNSIPYTGMRFGDSAIAMQKSQSKTLAQWGLSQALSSASSRKTLAKVLPGITIAAPRNTTLIDPVSIEKLLEEHGLRFPLCVKPQHLGSSIGVARADNMEQLQAKLAAIFMIDNQAICEPFIQNKREFNIAVANLFEENKTTFSQIEEPINDSHHLLDFDKKYRSGGKAKTSGLASCQRVIDPDICSDLKKSIIQSTDAIYNSFDRPSGIPRLDYLYDVETKELYFNEINPCPGSFGHYLWKGHPNLGSYGKLIRHLINEALVLQNNSQSRSLQVPISAQIFPKKRLY